MSAIPADLRTFIYGGGGGIRTLDQLAPIMVFKTIALDHYATPPRQLNKHYRVKHKDYIRN